MTTSARDPKGYLDGREGRAPDKPHSRIKGAISSPSEIQQQSKDNAAYRRSFDEGQRDARKGK